MRTLTLKIPDNKYLQFLEMLKSLGLSSKNLTIENKPAKKEKLNLEKADAAVFNGINTGHKKAGQLLEFLPENKVTEMCMHVSEKSLHEDWDNEDDAHWEKFLKDK